MTDNLVQLALGIEGQKVVMTFPQPVTRIEFDPPNIQTVACRMTDLAFEADSGLKPVGDTLKSELIERHRKTLIRRVELVMNSTRENRKVPNHKLAQEIVEICLKEIF